VTGRILGIDFGDAHTGIAVSDPLGITAQPHGAVNEKEMARVVIAVAEAATMLGATAVVVGLPMNMNGSEGPRAKLSRDFGAQLGEVLSVPIHFWDERLTTAQAGRALRGRGGKKRKMGIDVVSAQVMLQSYLDAAARGAR
jgi:putative Holliday junction resolvase